MKTFKKVLLAILISLAVAFGIYVLVSFIVNKDGTMYWINKVIEWVNQPLPIVGVTTLAVLVFVWKLIVTTQYGKTKLAAYDRKVGEIEKQYEEYKAAAEKEKEELKKQNDELKGFICHICELSTNQKIKNYGKELLSHGEETTNR